MGGACGGAACACTREAKKNISASIRFKRFMGLLHFEHGSSIASSLTLDISPQQFQPSQTPAQSAVQRQEQTISPSRQVLMSDDLAESHHTIAIYRNWLLR